MTARDPVLKMVSDWQENTCDPAEAARLNRILENLRFLERVKFTPYVPTLYSRNPASYSERLHCWLNSPAMLSPTRKRDLFEFASLIAFFSFGDFTAMFQNAFAGPVSSWCMETAGIRLDQPNWQIRLDEERYQTTWFCPVTDSLLISVFHHVNEIEGKDRKPVFRDLKLFGDQTPDRETNKIRRHIRDKGYKRIVLLEDFVGTGTQSIETIEWSVRKLGLPVLFCPMIIASEGADRYRKLKRALDDERGQTSELPEFAFVPVFEMGDDCFVHTAATEPESLFGRIRSLAEEIHQRLSESQQHCKDGPLGFWKNESPQKGATVVMFSNTPNNSLPLLHHDADQKWRPLFPRVSRHPL